MRQWKYEEGYEGKKVVNPDSIDLGALKTDEDFILACAELSKASHWRKDQTKGTNAWSKCQEIIDIVRRRLETVGWHAHIFKTGSCECNCNRNDYLHMLAGLPQVSEVPFSSVTNVELKITELCNKDGSLRIRDETMKLLKNRIGDDEIDLGNIDEEVAKTIKAIMKAEKLDTVHDVDADKMTFRSGSKEYTWCYSDDDAEDMAREMLMGDDDLWRDAVHHHATDLGFKDWVEEVLEVDGWAHVVCSYDGNYGELDNGVVYWRTS
jgi:hypothetical protein